MGPSKTLASIVCPAYEEEEVLPLFYARLCDVLDTLMHEYEFEIVIVDDGSKDATLSALKQLASQDSRVRYLSLTRNFGHQAALTAGLEHARGDVVISLDCDWQHPPELIPVLLDEWKSGFEVVYTIRADDKTLGWFKRASSAMFYRLLAKWSDLEVRYAASDFRLMSRRANLALLNMRENRRFLRGMVQWLGFPAKEVPFIPNPRLAGQSKFTLKKMLRLAADGLFSFSIAPLRIALLFGTGATITSLIASTAFVFDQSRRTAVSPFAFAFLFLLHVVGLSMFVAIGVLGEYVVRIGDDSKRRPLYVVKDSSCNLPIPVRDSQPPPFRSTAA